MKNRLLPLALLAVVCFAGQSSAAPSEESGQRIQAAYLLTLGRAPTADELRAIATGTNSTIAGLAAQIRQRMTSDVNEARAVATRACEDAFGRAPDAKELSVWADGGRTYVELMTEHVQLLASRPDTYDEVIERAYHRAVQRDAHTIEHDYWKSRRALPFILLVGCIEHWAQRNAPGLMTTTGIPSLTINSTRLTTLRLSPAVAREARATMTPGVDVGNDFRHEVFGHTIVAPGADAVVSVGGIHIMVIGRAGATRAP